MHPSLKLTATLLRAGPGSKLQRKDTEALPARVGSTDMDLFRDFRHARQIAAFETAHWF